MSGLAVIIVGLVIGGLAWGVKLFEPHPAPKADRIVETVLVTQMIEVQITWTPVVVTPHVLMTAAPTPVSNYGKQASDVWLSVSEMIQHLRQLTSDWSTMWMDASVVSYGPIGYIGPPRVTRIQLWLSEDRMLWLSGDPSKGPKEIILGLTQESKYYRAELGPDAAWFLEVDNQQTKALSAITENLPLFINSISMEAYFRGNLFQGDGMSFRILGEDKVAGRVANQVEQRDLDGRLINQSWIDKQTGLVLRSQQFAEDYQRSRITDESIVSAVVYNVDFPQALFDPSIPWQGGYVQDYMAVQPADENLPDGINLSGSRPRLLKRWMPDDFNPFQSRLAFQYPEDFDAQSALSIVSILGDYFWLGDVYFGNPWTMICDRSPDGRKIAFVSQPFQSPSSDAALRWFTLSTPMESVHIGLPGISITQLVFAADSRRLAAFGFNLDGGGVFLLDTDTGESMRLVALVDARSLAWSPNGEYLALIGRIAESPEEDRVMAIEVPSGRIVFDQSIDFESGGSQDWPMAEWGIEFPVDMGDMEACVSPPIRQ